MRHIGHAGPLASPHARGVLYALSAAALFGASTPFIRPALAATDAAAAAGYLYLGQAVLLSAVWLAGRARGRRTQAGLGRADLAPLVAGIVAGGLIAPGAFTAGLALLPAHRVSLLLGLEIVFTLLIALLFRNERLSGRAWCGVILLLGAGLLVSLSGAAPVEKVTASAVTAVGSLLVALACAGWAVDSNLTAGISGKDPTAISLLKGWAAAAGYLGFCVLSGRPIRAQPSDLATLLVAGGLGYGVSLRFFILALRHLGAALTTSLFSTASLAGFAASVLLFGERPSSACWAAFALAALGVSVVSAASHAHEHAHEEMTHEHAHVHDEHHQHEHEADVGALEGHCHVHRHSRLVHGHPHDADQHHTHRH